MRITCTQENLGKGLGITSHLAGKNINLPILNNLLLEAKGGLLNISSTNLEIGIKTIVRGKVESEGNVTVPAKLISDYVSLQKPGNIDLEVDENDLIINTAESQTKIKGNSAEDYPLIPDIDNKNPMELGLGAFKNALQQTVYAAAFNDTRPEISGILFKMEEKKLILAATDSYRLAEKMIDIEELPGAVKTIIVPLRTVHELLRVSPETEGDKVKIFIEENQIKFSWDETSLVSRLTEGEYPDYRQIIPDNFQTKISFNKDELVKVVKMASLFTRSGFNNINLKFANNEITVLVANAQVGENKSVMPAEIEGGDNEIVFNYKYLLDGLSNMNGSKVVLGVNSSTSPGLLRVKDDESYLYLIMPIRQ